MLPAAGPRPSPVSARLALGLALILFGCYGLTASKLRFGYEGANIDQAEALLRGDWVPRLKGGIAPYTQGGLADVAAYFPFAALKLGLDRTGLLFGLRQLIYPFVVPLYTVALLLVLFGLGRDLYGRSAPALALTLVAGLATMLWPYAKFGMETQQTLWTLAAVWALVRYHRVPAAGAAAAFGIALALLMLTKITGPLHAAALLLAAGWIVARRGARPGGGAHVLLVILLTAGGAAIFLFSNRWRYGGWLWAGRYGMGFELSRYPLWEALWAVAASPGESLLLFCPPLLISLWFIGSFWRRFPVMRPILVLMLAVGILHLRNRPWADETWGPRRLHYLVPLLALPLGAWFERLPDLRRPVRWLGWAVVAAGFGVQLIAVAFDYTAQAFVLGRTPLYSQENTVWDPQLSPIRFNLHLLRSAAHRAATGEAIPFVYERHYLPWTKPDNPPPPESFSMEGYDHFDLWYFQQRADWPDRPYWFHSPSSFVVPLLGLMIVGGILLLATTREAKIEMRRSKYETNSSP